MRVTNTRQYNQGSNLLRGYQINTICNIQINSKECQLIQAKKDELLVSLTKYFSREIEKQELSSSLTRIKRDLTENCPSYVSKSGCC